MQSKCNEQAVATIGEGYTQAPMNRHALDKLEFVRVLELVAGEARTSLGRSLALRIRPGGQPAAVRKWLQQTDEMLEAVEQADWPPIGGVQDVRGLVKDELHSCLEPEQLAEIRTVLEACHAVHGWAAGLNPARMGRLVGLCSLAGRFEELIAGISRVVAADGSVRDDASERLQTLRLEIRLTLEKARSCVDAILQDPGLNRWLSYIGATYHADRLVVPLAARHQGRIRGIVHRTSDTGETLFLEPEEAVAAHNRLVSLRASEKQEISRLLWQVTRQVRSHAEQVVRSVGVMEALDLLCAKAGFARRYGGRVAQIAEPGCIRAVCARHPLLVAMRGIDAVVPLDLELGGEFDILLITGPNTGGKTVALKTVGLLCLMHQAGLPVTAGAGTALPAQAEVLCDIGDEQSLDQSLSTFAAHCKNMLEILEQAREHTLVLLDELGAGTDPDEGAALGAAVLEELGRRGCHAVVTTHSNALKAYAYRRGRVQVGCVEFDAASLQPLYRLKVGEPGQSNALLIAERLGLPRSVVSRARRFLDRRHQHFQQAIEATAAKAAAAERARASSAAAEARAHEIEAAARRQLAALELARQRFDAWLARVGQLEAGQKVFVRKLNAWGTLVRLRISRELATISVQGMEVTVGLRELDLEDMPSPVSSPPLPMSHKLAPNARKRAKTTGTTVPPRPDGGQRPDATPPPHGKGPQPGRSTRERGRSRPVRAALSPESLERLRKGDRVFVRAFGREAEIIWVDPQRGTASVSMGMLVADVRVADLSEANPSNS